MKTCPAAGTHDPFGRYEERYFINGESSHLVRTDGVEASDPPTATVGTAREHLSAVSRTARPY
jgi:hypothetical protein